MRTNAPAETKAKRSVQRASGIRDSGAANNNYVVAIGGKKLQFAMPASGWATVKYSP